MFDQQTPRPRGAPRFRAEPVQLDRGRWQAGRVTPPTPDASGRAAPLPSALLWLLLTLRFLLELALLAAYVVALGRLVGGVGGWVLGVVVALLVAGVWGVLLSPRRPVSSPVALRVAIELVLFVVAGALLAASGLVLLGVLLVASELLVLGLLQGPDKHAL